MRNVIIGVILFLIMNLNVNSQTLKNVEETENMKSEFGKILDSLGVEGSILIYDNASKTYYSNDYIWAKEGNLPASTFTTQKFFSN